MKYIFRNIRNFIKNDSAVFSISAVCMFVSALMVFVFIGMYHQVSREKQDTRYGRTTIDIFFKNTDSIAYKNTLMKMLDSMDDTYFDNVLSMGVGGYMPGDREELVTSFSFTFAIENGRITVSEISKKNLEARGGITSGAYISKAQYEAGENVALIFDHSSTYGNEGAEVLEKYEEHDGYVTIAGKEYKVIGTYHSMYPTPIIPITAAPDDMKVTEFGLAYKRTMTNKEYEILCDSLEEFFGDNVEIPEYRVPDVDSTRYNNTIIRVCILIILMSALVFTMLLKYVVMKRRKQLLILRMCGCTYIKAKVITMLEGIFLSLSFYIMAAVVFRFVVMKQLLELYYYIAEAVSIRGYFIIGITYVVITALVTALFVRPDKSIREGWIDAK